MNDPVTRELVGNTIWHAAKWVEAHSSEMPYEMFTESNDTELYGYRITVERIPYQPPAHHPITIG